MRLLAFALALMTALTSFGINYADSVKVCFRVGQRQYDPSLGDNRILMDDFLAKVRHEASGNNIESIVVRGYASPEGGAKANERLAHNRCLTIADYIASNTGIERNLIHEKPMGVDWSELRHLVAENPDVPSREKILEILDNTPVWIFSPDGKIIDSRKKQLMDLRGGRPYNWMLAHLFPQMRNAVAVMLYTKEQPKPLVSEVIVNDESSTVSETTVEQPETVVAETTTTIIDEPVEAEYAQVPIETPETPLEYKRLHFALKTNLLYDAALLPNLELEWLINDNWSVSVEGDVAWWKPSFTKVYRLAVVSPEVRYHIRPRAPWHGMYVGLFGGGGLYQLENGGDGYRGEGGMGGLSFGYMWPLGKHFSFDAEIGVGYLYSRYKVYQSLDGHKLYLRTKSLNYVGPLKLKFSIAWRFDIKTAKKLEKVSSTL